MTQDPHHSGPQGPGGTPHPPYSSYPPPPGYDAGRLPDYRPATVGGPGQVPGSGQYGNPTPASTSTVVLTIFSGVLTLSGICCVIGVIPLILGVVAMTKNSTDPDEAAKLTRIGWVVLIVLTIIVLLAILATILIAVTGSPSGDSW